MSETQNSSSKGSLHILGLILAVIGLGISIYSLQHHIDLKQGGATDAMCNINETFSCDSIANSKYSEDPWGNPLGLYGIAYFLGLILLLVAASVKEEYRRDTLPTYALMTALGVCVSVALYLISHFEVGAFCLTCIGVCSVTGIQALVTFFLRAEIPKDWGIKNLYNGAFYMLLALLGSMAGFQIFEPMPTNNFTPDLPQTAEDARELINKMQAPQIRVDKSAYSGMGEDFRKGGDDAKVTIVEFADFQCPACASAAETMNQLAQEFGDRILIVFKNYPLDGSCNKNMGGSAHQHACQAAITARCAGQFGKFWPMHDKIFSEQRKIDKERLRLWSLEMGISKDQFDECLASQDILAKIKDDIAQASQLNIQGTPAIFINGMPAASRSYSALRSQISFMLGQ